MQGKDHDALQPQRFMKGCMRFVSCHNMIVLIESLDPSQLSLVGA